MEFSELHHWPWLRQLKLTITIIGITTTDIIAVSRTGKDAELSVMTGGIGIDIAVITTALEDMEVIYHFVLPTPMDMATGMVTGITILLAYR